MVIMELIINSAVPDKPRDAFVQYAMGWELAIIQFCAMVARNGFINDVVE